MENELLVDNPNCDKLPSAMELRGQNEQENELLIGFWCETWHNSIEFEHYKSPNGKSVCLPSEHFQVINSQNISISSSAAYLKHSINKRITVTVDGFVDLKASSQPFFYPFCSLAFVVSKSF